VPAKESGLSCLMFPNFLTTCKERVHGLQIVRDHHGTTIVDVNHTIHISQGPSLLAYKCAKDWNNQLGMARAYLKKASKKKKKLVEKKRHPREFQV